MSMTDPKGRITYANEALIKASGDSHDELMGQPHNLSRHPDMPAPTFVDLWHTLETGRWKGDWTAFIQFWQTLLDSALPEILNDRYTGNCF